MLIRPKTRNFLNRRDPRVRGRVTWFPLEGHFSNMGDLGLKVPNPGSGYAFKSGEGGAQTISGTGVSNSQLTAATMGVTGAVPRTIFFKAYWGNTAVNWLNLFSVCGTGSTTRNDMTVAHADSANLEIVGWGDDKSAQVAPGSVEATVWIVITYNGSTAQKIYSKAVRSDTGATNHYVTTNTLGGVMATQSAGTFNLWGGGAYTNSYTGDGVTGLRYVGVLGGTLWSQAEALSWLDNPDELWTLAPPFQQIITKAPTTAVGTAAGSASVSGVGAAQAASVGASDGASTVAGIGGALAASTGSADGTSTASGVSSGSSAAIGTATGSSAVSGAGAATVAAVAAAAGAGDAFGVAAALSAAIGTAAGTSTATGFSTANAAAGSAAGTATVIGVGASIARSVGSASGTSTVAGASPATRAMGFAAGRASVTGVGRSLSRAAGTAAGTSRTAGVALQIAPPSQAATTRHRTVAIPRDRRLVLVPLDLRIARGTMTDLEFLPKDPADDLNDYQIRFGVSLNAITSVTATLSQSAGAVPMGTWTTPGDTLPGSPLSVSEPRLSDDRKAVIFRAAGGVPGKKYAIRVVAQLAAGPLYRSAILPVTGL